MIYERGRKNGEGFMSFFTMGVLFRFMSAPFDSASISQNRRAEARFQMRCTDAKVEAAAYASVIRR